MKLSERLEEFFVRNGWGNTKFAVETLRDLRALEGETRLPDAVKKHLDKVGVVEIRKSLECEAPPIYYTATGFACSGYGPTPEAALDMLASRVEKYER